MARSAWVAHAFEWEKLLKCHLKGKASEKLANGQNIDFSEKRKWPKGFICPCTGVKYHNCQTCLLVYAADSAERLQDHWSSGLKEYLCFGFQIILTEILLLSFKEVLNSKDRVNSDTYEMSGDVRKPVFGVSDQIRHKPDCTSSEKS